MFVQFMIQTCIDTRCSCKLQHACQLKLCVEFYCMGLQCWKFQQVHLSEADNFGGGPGTFCWFFFNFMFMIWDSRHMRTYNFLDWVSNTGAVFLCCRRSWPCTCSSTLTAPLLSTLRPAITSGSITAKQQRWVVGWNFYPCAAMFFWENIRM